MRYGKIAVCVWMRECDFFYTHISSSHSGAEMVKITLTAHNLMRQRDFRGSGWLVLTLRCVCVCRKFFSLFLKKKPQSRHEQKKN